MWQIHAEYVHVNNTLPVLITSGNYIMVTMSVRDTSRI